MPTFSSSSIDRAEYDVKSRVLRIWFVKAKGHYDYYDVPEGIFHGLCQAASKGGYYRRYIKDLYLVN